MSDRLICIQSVELYVLCVATRTHTVCSTQSATGRERGRNICLLTICSTLLSEAYAQSAFCLFWGMRPSIRAFSLSAPPPPLWTGSEPLPPSQSMHLLSPLSGYCPALITIGRRGRKDTRDGTPVRWVPSGRGRTQDLAGYLASTINKRYIWSEPHDGMLLSRGNGSRDIWEYQEAMGKQDQEEELCSCEAVSSCVWVCSSICQIISKFNFDQHCAVYTSV